MPIRDEWSGLADFLANMIEKYADELEIENLPNPERFDSDSQPGYSSFQAFSSAENALASTEKHAMQGRPRPWASGVAALRYSLDRRSEL